MKRGVLLTLALLVIGAVLPMRAGMNASPTRAELMQPWLGGAPWLGWRIVDGLIRQRFGEVPTISTTELSAALADPKHATSPQLLLDVREPAEYAVSHLPGARRISPDADGSALVDWPKDAPVVTYCSVGYRSAAFARRLRSAGFTNVRNLRGSIFAWANESRPMVDAAGQPTTFVHPYDRVWGTLVAPEHRAALR